MDIDIEVDGGIKADWTIAACADAGANCFIAGSGLLAYPTLLEGCDEMRKVAKAAQNGFILKQGQTFTKFNFDDITMKSTSLFQSLTPFEGRQNWLYIDRFGTEASSMRRFNPTMVPLLNKYK